MPKASEILLNKFPFEPTQGQRLLFSMIDTLLSSKADKPILLLKGYAGTGKTSVISTLAQVLPLFNMKYVLLAPTGRAAKVMSSYSKKMAFTIHKRIYKQVTEGEGTLKFKRQKNYSKNTVFIVDEASMINQETSYGNKGLLSDLMDYIFSESSNRLILVGDNAQLPPVGQLISPALEADFLVGSFKMDLQEIVLTEVMRQQAESGILWNATKLRQSLTQEKPHLYLETAGFSDLFKMTSERLEDGLRYAYDKFGIENSIIICRSNKLANNYNQYIRQRIHFHESELEAGEILMAVRNNYVHTPDELKGGFVANGDFLEVTKIVSF
ncbi:MAG: AAA family ATPase, partial [Bacteroidota bacterium]